MATVIMRRMCGFSGFTSALALEGLSLGCGLAFAITSASSKLVVVFSCATRPASRPAKLNAQANSSFSNPTSAVLSNKANKGSTGFFG